MRIQLDDEQRAALESAIGLRAALRRVAAAARFDGPRCQLDALTQAPHPLAVAYRPRLRSDVAVNGAELHRGDLRVILDDFDRRFVETFDGQRSLGEAAILAANGMATGRPNDPVAAALEVVEALARYDLLETGQQKV